MKKLYNYIIEMNFCGRDFGRNNYVSDVINTLCTKSTIRLGKTGDEVKHIVYC